MITDFLILIIYNILYWASGVLVFIGNTISIPVTVLADLYSVGALMHSLPFIDTTFILLMIGLTFSFNMAVIIGGLVFKIYWWIRG